MVSLIVYPRDVVMLLCLIFMCVLVVENWQDFGTCDPLNLWMLVDCIALILFRLVQFGFQIAYSYSDRQRRTTAFWVATTLGLLNLWVLFPFLWIWVLIGSVWFVRSFRCLPEDNSPFAFFAWIMFTALYLSGYGVLIAISYRMRHARRTQIRLADLQNILDNVRRAQAYGIMEERTGLTPSEIDSIPLAMVTPQDEPVTCSICLADLQTDDVYRSLPCRHRFHMQCLDQWLQVKETCPNCLQVVACESSSLLDRSESPLSTATATASALSPPV